MHPPRRLLAAAALAALAALVPVLAACTTVRRDFMSAVDLGPGGRAEGTFTFHGEGLMSLRLHNRGPGSADYVLRTPSGRVLSSGPLDSVLLMPDGARPEGRAVVVLEAGGESGTIVGVLLSAETDPGLEWDLSRARP